MRRSELKYALSMLNERLVHYGIVGEIGLYDGTVMCLALNAGESAHDIDAIFNPKMDIIKIANELGLEIGIEKGWLTDGVKCFVSSHDTMIPFCELSNISIYAASPQYMFTMKALFCRVDVASDINDIKFLIRYLGINNMEQAENIIYSYYPKDRVQQKTICMLMELMENIDSRKGLYSIVEGLRNNDNTDYSFYDYMADFLDQFYEADDAERLRMVQEEPKECTKVEEWEYSFMAATVHSLCLTYNLDCPLWALDLKYALDTPKFAMDVKGDLRLILIAESPYPFKVRNLFVPDNVLSRA